MNKCVDTLIVNLWFRGISVAWHVLNKVNPRRFFHARNYVEAGKPVDDSGVVFVNYNVVLPDGRQTNPGKLPVKERPDCKSASRLLATLFPDNRGDKRIVDIGCLEGGYATNFAEMGFDATGLEVRAGNIASCEVLRRAFGMENLKFVHDDALNLEKYGQFDATFCSGLLYHLQDPKAYVQLLGRVTKKVTIINTQVAPESFIQAQRYHLSPIVKHEGARGRWFLEFPENIDNKAREDLRWAAWGNNRSFWMTRGALMQAMYEAGFDLVFEQFDHFENSTDDATRTALHQARGVFIGIKTT